MAHYDLKTWSHGALLRRLESWRRTRDARATTGDRASWEEAVDQVKVTRQALDDRGFDYPEDVLDEQE